MKKKLFALLTVLSLALGLTACGGGNGDTEEAGKDSGAASFSLGTIGPLTGENAIYGQAVANGAKVAVDEINAAAGSEYFTLRSLDDVADPETAVNAYHDLLDNGMQVLVSPTTTGASIEVSSHVSADRVFMLTPSASSPDVTAGKDNVFQVCFTDPALGTLSADYMAEHMADATIGVLYRSDDPYSQGVRDAFAAEAEKKGLNVAYESSFTNDTSTNFEVQLTGARSAGVDLLFIPVYFQPASVILNQAKALGYAPTFFGVDGLDGLLAMENFDTSLAEGVVMMTPFSADSEDETTANFVKTYEEQFGTKPNQFAADAYDGVYIVKAALEKAGCTPDQSPEEICEALVAVMPELTVDGLTGKNLTWDASGAVSKEPMVMVIQNGVYVPVQ